MVSEFSPDYACGQIIFNIKSSKLNYLVKETPYSLYITVRKKFVNNVREPSPNLPNSSNILTEISENGIVLRQENCALKEKLKDLKTSYALIEVENEELETKAGSLNRDAISMEDKLEEAYLETRNAKEVVIKMKAENQKLIATLPDQKDLEENILILEHVIEAKDQQIYNLKQEIRTLEQNDDVVFLTVKEPTEQEKKGNHLNFSTSDDNLPSTSKCGTCDFTSDDKTNLEEHEEIHSIESEVFEFICSKCDYETNDERDLKKHYEVKHSLFTCKVCHMTIRAESKLNTHMCRVIVKNPTHKSLYMKGWYDNNGCAPIFCKLKNQEFAWLHHKKCFIEPCAARQDFIENSEGEKPNEMEFANMKLDSFITSGDIDWEKILHEIAITQNN